jgi:hypothetical protein
MDGGAFRIEIPSVEGPRVLEAVLREADTLEVPLHRVSQGSGIQLLTDGDIRDMAQMGHDRRIEVSLFIGPRAGFEPSAMQASLNGGVVRPRLRGLDALRAALDDAYRAYDLGIRSILAADEGLIALHHDLKARGLWPSDLRIKGSVMLGAANPVSIKMLAEWGIATYNCPTDLTVEQMAAVRQVTPIPFDLYVESPDDVGGFVRYREIPDFIRYLAPVYLKYGLRNAPNIYPSGLHWEAQAVAMGRERVHRARAAWERIQREGLADLMSPVGQWIDDLAIPSGPTAGAAANQPAE